MDFDKITDGFEIENIFFNCGYPMLFSCRDKDKKLYLTVCCQNNKEGIRWLLKETEPSIIVEMLRDDITLRDAFLKGDGKQLSFFYNYKKTVFCENNKEEWDPEKSIYLPDAGEYIDAEEGEFDEDIEFYEKKVIYSEIDFSAIYGKPKVLDIQMFKGAYDNQEDDSMDDYALIKTACLPAFSATISSLIRTQNNEDAHDQKLKITAA